MKKVQTMQMTKWKAFIGGGDILRRGMCNRENYGGYLAIALEKPGDPSGGMYIDDYYIPPEDISVDVYKTRYFIRHNTSAISILGELEIVKKHGYGHITINKTNDYVIKLEPWAPHFHTWISVNAGACYDKNRFVYDAESTQWKEADWQENQMDFSYDIYVEPDPFMPLKVTEAQFEDTAFRSLSPVVLRDREVAMSKDDIMVVSCAEKIDLPRERRECEIRSVFPQKAHFQFNLLGKGFHGAYMDSGEQVYAIRGEYYDPAFQKLTLAGLHRLEPLKGSRSFHEAGNLDIYGLVSMNPIVADQENHLYDKPGRESSDDIYSLILTAMDKDLRDTYYGKEPPELSPAVREIYNGDAEAPGFYKSLQLPMLAGAVGKSDSRSPYAGQINTLRANCVMRTACTDNVVYKRQSDLLYRAHFLESFGSMKAYLEDQKNHDHTEDIRRGIEVLRTYYRDMYGNSQDPQSAENLNMLLVQLDGLEHWAVRRKLYWAFMLYYYLEKTYIPKLLLKMCDGTLSENVSVEIKNFSALFQMLEGAGNPEGVSFNKAFMDTVATAQLGAILPQMMDYQAHFSEFHEVFEAVLGEFVKRYQDSGDAEIRERVVELEQILQDRAMAQDVFDALSGAMSVSGTGASWTLIMTNFESLARQKIPLMSAKGISMMGISFACFLIGKAIWQGSFDSMTTQEQVSFISTCAGLVGSVTYFVVRNGIRLYYVWNDISGAGNCVRVLIGSSKMMPEVNAAIARLQSSAADFFLGEGAQTGGKMGTILRVFGRNATKFACATVGAVFAVITLVTTALELHSARTSLELAGDSLFIASSSFQIIALGMNFALAALEVTEGVLPVLCAGVGALGALAAVAGLVIMAVILFTQSDPPDPTEKLVKEHLQPAGLAMPSGCAVEYISVQADSADGNIGGYSLGTKEGSRYLCVDQAGQAGALKMADMDYSGNVIWCLEADRNGRARIYTIVDRKDGGNGVRYLFFTSGEHILRCGGLPEEPGKLEDGSYDPDDVKRYEAELEGYYWESECKEYEKEDGIVTKAVFSFRSALPGNHFYLDLSGNHPGLSSREMEVQCRARRLGVSSLEYDPEPFRMITGQKDQCASVYFKNRKIPDAVWTADLDSDLPLRFQEMKESNYVCLVQDNEAELTPMSRDITVKASVQRDGKTIENRCDVRLEIVDGTWD